MPDRSQQDFTRLNMDDITGRNKAEELLVRMSSTQQSMNDFMLELYMINDYDELIKTVVRQIDQLLSPLATSFSEYDHDARVLRTKEIKTNHGVLDLLAKIGGEKLLSTPTPVSDDMQKEMLADRLKIASSIHEVFGGALPKAVSNRIDKAFKIKCYLGISYIVDDQVFGTSVVALYQEPESYLIDLLKSYAHFISISLKRILSEQALRKTTIELKAITDNMSELVTMTDLEGRFTFVSGNHYNLIGYTKDELLGRYAWDIIYDQDSARLENLFRESLSAGKDNQADCRVVHKDGSLVWVDIVGSILFDNGKPAGALLVTRDITDRKRAEEALKMSEERLNLAMMVKNEGIWDWNLVTDETIFDERYYTMAGYAPNEFPQNFTEWEKRVHPDDIQKADSAIKAYLSGQSGSYDTEFRFKHRNGSWIWIRAQGKIVERDENGSPLRMVGTHTDISERKQAQETLQKNLQEKNVLLSEIHHRVKNNMAVISSLLTLQSEYGEQKKNPEKLLKDLQTRIMSMSWVHELVYESSDFSQIQSEKLLSKLANYLKNSYQTDARQITVQVHSKQVMLDMNNSVPLTLLIAELLTNALKHAFTDRRTGRIIVLLEGQEPRSEMEGQEPGSEIVGQEPGSEIVGQEPGQEKEQVEDKEKQKVREQVNGRGLRLVVEDDGVGVADIDRLNNPESFGYTIIHGLAQQLRGQLEFSSPPDGGLKVEAWFPEIKTS